MKKENQPLDRQQLLIDLYTQYLFGKITLGQLLNHLRKNVLGLSQEKYAAMEWIQALEPLDSKYRLVVLLYYMEGFGIREISDILDMKESTVKSRLYRGRKQIAEMYGYKVKEGRV